jgi:hypothetical protein
VTNQNIATVNEENMPSDRITCTWEENTTTAVKEIGALVNKIMNC